MSQDRGSDRINKHKLVYRKITCKKEIYIMFSNLRNSFNNWPCTSSQRKPQKIFIVNILQIMSFDYNKTGNRFLKDSLKIKYDPKLKS